MRAFAYHRPRSPADAVGLIADAPGAMPLAGGTNLVDLMKEGIAAPTALVDLGALAALRGIGIGEDGALVLGALATNAAVAGHPAVLAHYPLLSEALLAGATPQIRNAATVAGNLLQSNRCPAYWDKSRSCTLRKPDEHCSGRDGGGVNRAIFARGPCPVVFPSDFATALLALDARVRFIAGGELADMPLADLYRRDSRGLPQSGIPADGLITEVRLAASPFRAGQAYVKVRERASFAFAIASVAAAVRVDEGRISAVRVAAGSVADRPWALEQAEAALLGQRPARAAIEQAATLAMEPAQPLAQDRWKCAVLRGAIIKALAAALQRETGEALA